MDIWKILEINPTNNKEDIDKAYEKIILKSKYEDDIDLNDVEIAYKYALEEAEAGFGEVNFNEESKEKPELEHTQELNDLVKEEDIDLEHTQELKIIENEEDPDELDFPEEEEKEIKDLNLMELSISKKFEDIINFDYWKEYCEKFKNTEGFIKSKITENLEKFIYNNFQVIPKDILKYIIKELNILENKTDILEKIDTKPDFDIYKIEGLSYSKTMKFFKLRYEAYYRLNYEFDNLREIGKVFKAAEKINSDDIDLKLLKIPYGILEDIEFAQEDSLIFSKTTSYYDEIDGSNKEVYRFYSVLINVYNFNQKDNIDEQYIDFDCTDYIPYYLNIFLKGYINYLVDDVDIAFDYWFNREIGHAPRNLGNISQKLILRKYTLLNEDIQQEIKAMGLMDKTVTISDIFSNIDLAYDFSNWRIIFETISPEELSKIKDKVVHYITNYYKILPKKTVEYIYEKVDLDNFENLKISDSLKDEIKNMPNMSNYIIDIPKDQKVEYYFNRYDYYANSAILNRRRMSDTLYKELKEVVNDFDVELIRVQQLFFEDTMRNQGYERTKNKIDSLQKIEDNRVFEFYNIFIETYNSKAITDNEFNRFLIIDQDKLLIHKDIINYINMSIYKLVGEEDNSNKFKEKIPNYFINKPVRRRNSRRKQQQEARRKALILSLATVVIMVLVIAIGFKIFGKNSKKGSLRNTGSYDKVAYIIDEEKTPKF